MTFSKYFEVRNGDGTLRFSSVFKIDTEFFLKALLRRLKEVQKSPAIVEVLR